MVAEKARTVAFPCISTGVYGFPAAAAAGIAVRTVREWGGGGAGALEEVTFCCFSRSDLDTYRQLLAACGD